jgi:hypothetical protein
MIMRLSEIKKIRDPYRLWYEFLKRSVKYKTFCETMRSGKSLEPTEENAKLLDVYYSWGDVFMNPFRKAYKIFKIYCKPITRKAVVDYKAEFRKRATDIIEKFEKENDRKMTVPELVNQLDRDFKKQTIVLKIDPTRGSDEEILTKLEEALAEKRCHPSTKSLEGLECVNNCLTTGSPDMKYLKTCLMVCELRKSGMKYSEIAKALVLPEWGDVERNLKRYNAAAEKLIESAEQGTFPGVYKPSLEDPYKYKVKGYPSPLPQTPGDAKFSPLPDPASSAILETRADEQGLPPILLASRQPPFRV